LKSVTKVYKEKGIIDNMKNEEMIQRKAQVFLDELSVVHLKLTTGTIYNGRLFEVSNDYLVVHDRVEGRKKIFFFEIKSIDEYTELQERGLGTILFLLYVVVFCWQR